MKTPPWDFALHVKGVTLDTLDMSRVADYLREFAGLLGEKAKPRLAGVVRGSVVLRARHAEAHQAVIRHRLKEAANDAAPGHDHYARISALLVADGARAVVMDSSKSVVIDFPSPPALPKAAEEYVIQERAELDGVVVGVEGVDETAHLRLQDVGGRVYKMQLRDMAMARMAAAHFRGAPIRASVRGTWRRSVEGEWAPISLHVESVEELDHTSAHSVLVALSGRADTEWARMGVEGAAAFIEELRGRE